MRKKKWLIALAAVAATWGQEVVRGPLISNDRWPRAADLVTWTGDVMRIEGLEQARETAQGKAFFEWLRLFCRMAVGGMIQAHEGDYGQERYVIDAHKNLFVYGWGFCDTCSRIADAAWSEFKRDAAAAQRVITQHEDGGYHTMYRLRLDGRYGAFDPRYGYYLIERDASDARVLDWREVGVDENFHRNREFRHRSRPFFEIAGIEWERALLVEPGFFESERAWRAAGAPKEHVFVDSHYQMGTRFHNMDFSLKRGMTIERFWDNTARKFYAPAGQRAQREHPFLASGRFYRVTDRSHGGNWSRHDPNYERARPHLVTVPAGEGYPEDLVGGRTIGQAWGRIRYAATTAAALAEGLEPGATLVASQSAPYLRPANPAAGGEAVWDFASPYVLVEGRLEADVAGAGAVVEIRTLKPKLLRADEPDAWSAWQQVPARTELGRPRYNGRDVSIHGVYRFQVRLRIPAQAAAAAPPAGLNALRVELDFENGVMAIPPIFAGANQMRFELRDAARLRGPVTVEYRYETAAGDRTLRHTLRPADFRDNVARYTLDASGLIRPKAVAISY